GIDLRLEGIVEPAPDAPILGTLSVRAGDRLRWLGVGAAQTSEDEGMSIFRGVVQYPENLRLVATAPVLRPFYEAAPGTRVRILGVFKPDLRWFLVGEIQVIARSEEQSSKPPNLKVQVNFKDQTAQTSNWKVGAWDLDIT